MSRSYLDVHRSSRSLVVLAIASLALAGGACGHPADAPDSAPDLSQREATLDDSCTTGSPTLSVTDSVLVLQCGVDTWVPPEVTAQDACGNPLPVHKYNTGDDDGDGIPGSVDADDYGPGPDTSVEGSYYVQYLAWDSYYNISGAIIRVDVVNCP